MQKFDVDDDLAALVESLAKKKPFENLSFNDALRRVLQSHLATALPTEQRNESANLLSEPNSPPRWEPKKTPTPSVSAWVERVPELKNRTGLNSWKAVCVQLNIETAGDSARRRLKNWVRVNRPEWPNVPDID
ncbi:MAG: hypothetical protein AUJ20_00410 [Comamonadaceae bacterium CG1_02_60_18]|nr:MAG: hypothetical protein AUJ20_00410 [Comamonadaceae bacterium CG1_02_60_18]PIQ56455.1 MAG: hypothetical protein COW02_01125 [Comamonadaceae bacterium CG12_big_fil_rev_8_21_14_0_65_59_15]